MMSRQGISPILLLAGALLLLLLPALAAAAPHRIIWDPVAEPSWGVEAKGAAVPSDDTAEDVVMADGGVTWVAGSLRQTAGNQDISLTRIVSGVKKWTKSYDSPYHKDDTAVRLATGPGGVVYTAGTSLRSAGNSDILLVKWSSAGKVLWARRYEGPAHGADFAEGLAVDKAGNVTVCGAVIVGTGRSWGVRNYTPSGRVRWTWRYDVGDGNSAQSRDIVAAGDGSLYITGAFSKGADPNTALTVRLSATGRKMWAKTYNGVDGLGAATVALALCPTGGVYTAGLAFTAASDTDGLVLRYSANGARKVFAYDTGPARQQFFDVAVASTRKVVAVGNTADSGSADCRATIYDAEGTIANGLTFPGVSGSDGFGSVTADSMGGFVAGGWWWAGAGNEKICVLRGSTLSGGGGWAAVWGGAVSSSTGGAAVAVRGSTTVVVGRYNPDLTSGTGQIALGFVY
jgi:hypothetical protein